MSKCSGSSGKARLDLIRGKWAEREVCVIGDCSLYGAWVIVRIKWNVMNIYMGIKDANPYCPGFSKRKIHSPLRWSSIESSPPYYKEQRPVHLSALWVVAAAAFTGWSSSSLPFTAGALLVSVLWWSGNCSPLLSIGPLFSQLRATWELPGSSSATSCSPVQLRSCFEWARSSASLTNGIRCEETSKGIQPKTALCGMLSCRWDKWRCSHRKDL